MEAVKTKAYGDVVKRKDREPAPLICEGTCGRVVMHTFKEARFFIYGTVRVSHEIYVCTGCGAERIWG